MLTQKELEGKKPEELVKIILEQAALIAEKDKAILAKDKEIQVTKDELDLTIKANEDLTLQIEEMSNTAPVVTAQPANGISQETFVVGNKEFGFKRLRLDHKNEILTATEVLASEELQQELVSIGSGFIYFIAEVDSK